MGAEAWSRLAVSLALALDLASVWPTPALGVAARVSLHVVAACCCGLGFRWSPKESLGSGAGVLIVALVLCFPVIGPLAAFAARPSRAVREAAQLELLEEYRALVDAGHEPDDMLPDGRLEDWERTWRALDLAAFSQVLDEHRDADMVASVYESARKLERSVACSLFRRALSSRVPTTRYYASTALARQEELCDSELADAQAQLTTRPGDADAMMRVGDARFAYTDLTAAGDPVSRFHLQEASRAYQQALDALADRSQRRERCRARLARSLLLSGDITGAWRHFSTLVEEGLSEPVMLAAAVDAAYQAGDYPGLVRTVAVARERCPESRSIRQLHSIWCDSGGS